jgi:hypothetical protein
MEVCVLKKVVSIGQVCVYCGSGVGDGVGCCGEVHHEEGYVEVEETFQEVDGCVILESELTDEHEVVE